MKPPCISLIFVLTALLGAHPLSAAIQLPAIISNHMVLLRSDKVPIWGKADGGEAITVTFNNQTVKTAADADGRWRVELNLEQSAEGPFELQVSGQNTITVSDVLVGEVWIASGQSNMEFALKRAITADQELALPANPRLRQFRLVHSSQSKPTDTFEGKWEIASPETVGSFSAVSYYFSKTLQRELSVPVGMVLTCWSGSACEAWISPQSLSRDPRLKAASEKIWQEIAEYPAVKASFLPAFEKWLKETHREDRPVPDPMLYAGLDVPMEGWVPLKLPGSFKTQKQLPETGVIWVRRDITLAEGDMGHSIRLELGPFDGFESLYWNGVKFSETTLKNYRGAGFPIKVDVGPSKLKVGRNVLAIRVYAPQQAPKFSIAPEYFLARSTRSGNIPLAGEWLARSEYNLPPLDAAATASAPPPLKTLPGINQSSSLLFNGMIYPILPYAIRGAIWYQGEANTGRSEQYRTTFRLLIEDWRTQWQRGDFPFYFCQLANHGSKSLQPQESNWAELREAQSLALALPHTGQAVIIDIGEAKDIHPRTKAPAGERLAALALARDYGKAVVATGPIYDSMKIEGDKIRVRFTSVENGLAALPLPETYFIESLTGRSAPLQRTSPESQLEGFAICGPDHQWKWADARIDGDTVVVSSKEVPKPVAVRYGWAHNPTCNLGNKAGLPASPFRSDDFPGMTRGKWY